MLSDDRRTICNIRDGLPNRGLRNTFFLLLELFNKMADVAFAGILHEDVEGVLVVIEG